MKDLLQYGLIASAGQPRSLTGEALIGLGALLSQIDFKLVEGEEDLPKPTAKPDVSKLKEANVKLSDGAGKLKGAFDKELQLKNRFFSEKTKLPNLFTPNERPVIQDSDEDEGEGTGRDAVTADDFSVETILFGPDNFASSFTPITTGETRAKQNQARYEEVMAARRAGMLDKITNFFSPGPQFAPRQIKTTSTFNRLKPEVLQILDGARYKNKGKDDTPLHRVAHITKSPYLRTDNVDYRQMRQATAPGYTGEIGKAAVEGYNLVIDKYNYDQAVKADYEEEVEDQMGSLNVEADFLTDQARQDYLELSMGKKKRLNEAFNSYANGDISKLDYENVKASLVSELQSAAATRTNITNSIKDFIENKGTIDTEASDPEMLDFLMTGEKSPERISIKNIDGIDYVTGTTRGGRDFKIPTSKIANGTAGFRVVKKASLAPVISGALKNINAYTSTVKTDLGFGVSTPNAKKARDIGIASIRTNLGSNEADLRSIMAQIYGVNHTAYQNFLGSDPAANKSAMLDDAAEYLYDTQVAEKYFPMTKTTRFTTERTGSTTAGERNRQLLSQSIANLPMPTAENFNQYKSLIDTQYDYKIKDGKLLIGLKGKKKDEISLTDPNFKSQFSRFAKLPAYIGQQQDLSGYNFDL
jgi:hypothetical protein